MPAFAAVWLQIDSPAHVAPILRLAVDARRDLVVTASDDRTARLWALSTGKPLGVFRAPVGPGQAGRLFAAAIHPTDDLVAVAGSGSQADGPPPSIWLIQASNGRFVRRIAAVGDHVRRLTWTADGKTLLACYAEPGGLRAFDQEGRLQFEEAYAADCLAVSAGSGSSIAAASRDRFVHRYRRAGTAIERVGRFATDGDPIAVALAPDEGRIAVGFFTSGAGAAIHQADSGQLLHRLATSADVRPPPRDGPFSVTQAVGWSADGRMVHTGGNVDRGGRVTGFIRHFDAASGRLVGEVAVSEDTVTDLVALPAGAGGGAGGSPGGGPGGAAGRVVWAGFAGDWGVVAANANTTRSQPRVEFIVRRGAAELMVSPDARSVRWLRGTARTPVSFEATSRQVGAGATAGLQAPVTRRGWTDSAENFVNHLRPSVRGSTVAMAIGEISRALTYVGNDGDVVLATSFGLRRLDRSLNTVWQARTATEVRAVNASADGRLVVTSMSDGTIRWWRADNGLLLLSLLVTREGWVMWSPTGHYDASPGGESLIGWLVDRDDGYPVPDFFGVARFRDRFLRPDVIDRILDLQDPDEAVRRADAQRNASPLATRYQPGSLAPVNPTGQPAITGPGPAGAVDTIRLAEPLALPPVLAALEPLRIMPGNTPYRLRFSIRASGTQPNLRIEARIDGKLAPIEQVSLPDRFDGQQPAQITVPITPGIETVQLLARDGDLVSEPLRFTVAGERVRAIEPQQPDGTLYLVAVGINRYRDNRILELDLATKDAEDFVAAMLRQRGSVYRDVVTRVLTGEAAGRADLIRSLSWLREQVGERDIGMVFLAGHGVNDSRGVYQFIAYDTDISQIPETGLSDRVIVDALGQLRGRAVLFMDTCHAGTLADLVPNVVRDTARLANTLSAPENSVSVFAASTGQQESAEGSGLANGVFTKFAIDGLRGSAQLTSLGVVTSHSLSPWLAGEVTRFTKGAQTPVAVIPDAIPDRVLSVVKAGAP